MRIDPVPAFNDNYIWIIREQDDGTCLIVDPGDAEPVIEFLETHGLQPEALLITHHHYDHTGGIKELVQKYSCPVYGPEYEDIEGITYPLRHGDSISLAGGRLNFEILHCPGHTLGHIAFYAKPYLFCGDTLFAGGCGRMFEGDPINFLKSLEMLADLPSDTRVYCAHEYTEANLKFAMAVEPENTVLKKRQQSVKTLRKTGQPTVPSLLSDELQTNPFLRCHTDSVKAAAEKKSGNALTQPSDVFAIVRDWKDHF